MSQELLKKTKVPMWPWSTNNVSFKNYTRCKVMVCIAYDEYKLDKLSVSISASKDAGIGLEIGRNMTDMYFIIPNVDNIRDQPVSTEKLINHRQCRISIYMISPQQYTGHSGDLTKWTCICHNNEFNARKYNYNILNKYESLCDPPPTSWKP